MDFIRDAASSGFPNYSGKNQNVKAVSNDSEVDERLKNIEPKMVELITNEVRKKHGFPRNCRVIRMLPNDKTVI